MSAPKYPLLWRRGTELDGDLVEHAHTPCFIPYSAFLRLVLRMNVFCRNIIEYVSLPTASLYVRSSPGPPIRVDENSGDRHSQYLISAALIVSGLTSILQVSRFKIPVIGVTVGTGIVSVMGTSFTFLPVARDAMSQVTPADKRRKVVYIYACLVNV